MHFVGNMKLVCKMFVFIFVAKYIFISCVSVDTIWFKKKTTGSMVERCLQIHPWIMHLVCDLGCI